MTAKRPAFGRALLRLLGPALLVVVIVRIPDRAGMLRAIASAAIGPLILASLLNLANNYLKVIRWQVLLRTRGIEYPTRRALPAFLSSVYIGMLTPGRVGDVLRVQYLRADLGVSYAEGLASIVMDRLCDLYVLVVFVAVGVVHYSQVIVGRLAYVTWGAVALIVLAPLLFLIPGVAERSMRGIYARLAGDAGADGLDRFLAAMRANVGRPLLTTVPLTVLAFLVNYVQGFIIGRSLGLDMSFFDAMCLLAIASLLGLLPVSVSGVGVRELFFSLTFPLLGFRPEVGVSFGLLVFVVIYLVNIAIGFASFLIDPPKAPPALDRRDKVADDRPPVFHRVRTTLSDTAASLDGITPRIATAARVWALWPLLYGITTGSAIWSFTHRAELTKIDTNKVSVPQSYSMLVWVLGSFFGLWFLYFLAMLWTRRRAGAWRVVSTATLLNKRLFPLVALPFLPSLLVPGVERDSPKLTFFFIAIVAAIVVKGAYAWVEPATLEAPLEPSRRERAAKIAAGLAVAAIWIAYGAIFSYLSIVNHRALNSRTIDLGYYDNIFYQSIHGRPLGCSLIRGGYHGSAHFDPLLVLLSPLYLIYPHAELILVLQAFWMGAGVVPMYLLARDKLGGRLPAVALALMYALYPALQGANMYEFHSLSLLSTILLWLLYFLEKGSYRGYFAVLPIALLCREDAALILCFVGAYAIISGLPKLPRLGWVTIVVSMIYLAVVKRFFMPSGDLLNSGKDSLSFAYYYDELIPNKNGVVGLVLSVVTNPVYVLKVVFAEPKVIYLLTLFVPLLFLPFFARARRVMLVYGLLFCLLATRSAVFSPAFQYSNTILAFAFALTPAALAQIADSRVVTQIGLDSRRYARALLAGALTASLLVSFKFGGIVENQSFHGGFVRIARGLTPKSKETYAWVREQVAKIPPAASVGITNKLGPHASNRKDVFFYPERTNVDYLFIDESELRAPDLENLTKNVKQGAWVELGRREKMVLFKKSK